MLMLWVVYNLLFPLVFLLMLPKFISRMLKRGGYGMNFEQRLGIFDAATKARLAEHPRVWVHAVSVGEIYVALRLMRAYRAAHPDVHFALSTNTSTGSSIARKEMDDRDVLFYFPVDLPMIIRKVLRVVQPTRLILVEAEYWPNLIRLADRAGIPISLVNGRVSASSHRGYMKIRPLTADVLRRIHPLVMQGAVDVQRIVEMGAPPETVHELGTVKFDVAERNAEREAAALQALRELGVGKDRILLLGGSTWAGEEKVLCEIYKRLRVPFPELFLVLVPRHMERAGEVLEMLNQQGLSFAQRSAPEERSVAPEGLLVDTTGELGPFYAAADLIFVGKSLCEHGGQNPIEPALCGKAVVVGPNMENFPAVMPVFLAAKALVQVHNAAELETTLQQLLENPAERQALGERAEHVVATRRGVMKKTVELLG